MREAIYVVIGMHRAGTSALTRALPVFGISLGNKLMPPLSNNNEKGFFEDLDLTALNEEILLALGETWDTLRLFELQSLDPAKRARLLDRGKELLEDKLRTYGNFAFKDPRTARLLPYWRDIFDELGLDPRYIIACRNPMSVASSLLARDGFPYEKSYVLWLEHMLYALYHTEGFKRVVVDYDRLIGNPRYQIERIQRSLALPLTSTRAADIPAYAEDFLSTDLRHWRYTSDALATSDRMPQMAVELYELLSKLSSDDLSPDDAACSAVVRRMWGCINGLAPALSLAEDGIAGLKALELRHRQEVEHLRAEASANQLRNDAELAAQAATLSERNNELRQLYVVSASERDRLLACESALQETAAKAESLKTVLHQKDQLVAKLEQTIRTRDATIAKLQSDNSAYKRRIAAVAHLLADQRKQLQHLNLRITERDAEAERYVAKIEHYEREVEVGADQLRTVRTQLAAARDASLNAKQSMERLTNDLASLQKRNEDLAIRLQNSSAHHGQDAVSHLAPAHGAIRVLWRCIERGVLRRNLAFRLVPNAHIKPAEVPGRWRSEGYDPHFHLYPVAGKYPSGWVLIRTSVQGDLAKFRIKLYSDAGNGITEAGAMTLPVTRAGSVLEIAKLPAITRALRWDPMDEPGEFVQGDIQISQIGPIERFIRAVIRVMRTRRQYSPSTLKLHRVSLRRCLVHPMATYAAASKLRGQHAVLTLEEERRAFLEAAYLTVLGRVPDPAGAHHYLQRLRAGVPMPQIIRELMASPEAATSGKEWPELREAIFGHGDV